jgi:hypothetical protein
MSLAPSATSPTPASPATPRPLPKCKYDGKFTWPTTPRRRAKGEEHIDDHRFMAMVISELNGHGDGKHCLAYCNTFKPQAWVNRRWSGKTFKQTNNHSQVHFDD